MGVLNAELCPADLATDVPSERAGLGGSIAGELPGS